MPKLPGKIEDWTAPWEKQGSELDPDRVKKLVYDLLVDQEKNRAKIAEDRGTIEKLTEERDSFKDAAEDASKGDDTKVAELNEARKDARKLERDAAKAREDAAAADADRFEVALDHGLTKSQAKRLVGDSIDDLVEDAKQLRVDLGLPEDPNDDGGDGEIGGDGGAGGGGGSGDDGTLTFYGRQRLPMATGGEQFHRSGERRVDPSKVELPAL